ncbi:hypothetical protein EDF67_11527 [Sphingobacterium sp. JUb78]|nr:hypothetical protein [Sphingobacterium kitahiroshimense]TCR00936.1 hypothetical protein EDF67_11527 [Sphingobacterium sp. JUb78]
MHIQPLFGSISPFLRKASTVFPPCLYCASTVFVEAQYTNRIGTVEAQLIFPEAFPNCVRISIEADYYCFILIISGQLVLSAF